MSEQFRLRKTIHSYDFAIYEMVLYLDTHPFDRMALQKLKHYKMKRAAAIEQYEAKFGPYVTTAAKTQNEQHWTWVENPWPWENEANCQFMWQYTKKLQYPVNIKNPNPKYAQIIISQYGGPDGELGASMRYLTQRYSMPYAEVKGLLTDIGTEEFAHG